MGKQKPMKKVCAWCGAVMLTGPPKPVSHGCCDKCYEKYVIPDLRRLEEDGKAKSKKQGHRGGRNSTAG